jgi:pyruvate kinase
MSRIRSDIPIYALTPHQATNRRVAMYRGVYPIFFALDLSKPRRLYQDIFNTMLSRNLVEVDDLVIFTKGDLDGVSGSTNAMKVLAVTRES